MFTYVVYILAVVGLIVSFVKDKEKTKKVLRTALRSFTNILPQSITILTLIAFFLTVLNPQQVSWVLGRESGVLGLGIGAAIGSITLIPPFVALPLIASLLKSGAGYPQVTAFLTTLTMVGVVTLPVEIKYLGRKTALKRNAFAVIYAFIAAAVIGVIML